MIHLELEKERPELPVNAGLGVQMKILFVSDNFLPEQNAIATRVYERACYWARWGHKVTVLTSFPNFPEGRLFPGYRNRWHEVSEIDGIRVVRVKTFMAPNAGVILRILDFISFMVTSFIVGLFESRPDVLAVTSPQFFAAVGTCMLAKVRRLPFVLEIADLWPESIVAVGAMKNGWALKTVEKLELFLYRRADVVIALVQGIKGNLVIRGVPEYKVQVVRNGVDLERCAPRIRDMALAARWGIRAQDFIVGYIGTHGMSHGLMNVVAAAAQTTDPTIHYLFVGAGSERDRLVAEAKRRGLGNVTFMPAQPKEIIPAAWSLCDIALVHLRNKPLFEAALPAKMFEAMGMGLPILLATPRGEASEILEKEQVGMWIPPDNPAALSAAISVLKSDPERLSEFRKHSTAAAPRYTRKRQAELVLDAFTDALARSPAAGDSVSESRLPSEVK
jgi:glycosyltransferase involved in cell wall biosynthesis